MTTINTWKPAAGEFITGTVAAVYKRDLVNEYGMTEYTQLILNTADGEVFSVNCIGASLSKHVERIEPKVGEKLGIGYKGEQDTKAGNKVRAYVMNRVAG